MHLEIMNKAYINKLQKIDSEICEQPFCLDRLEEIADIPSVCIHRGAQWSMATGSFSKRAGGVVPYVLVVSDRVLCPAASMAVIICIESLAAVMYLKSPRSPERVFVFVWGIAKENQISMFGDVPSPIFCVAVDLFLHQSAPIHQGVI